MKLGFILTDLLKSTEISDLMKIGVMGAELFHADGQTHRGTDEHDEATSLFFFFFFFIFLKRA